MSTTTSLLSLTKPDGGDAALISVLNGNMDILDNAVTLMSAQTLTNKTFTGPHMTTAIVDSGGLTVSAGGVTVTTGGLDINGGTVDFTGSTVIPNLSSFSNNISVDTAASGTQLIFDQGSLVASAKYWVTFGVVYTSAGTAGTQIGALVEDAVAGNGLLIAQAVLQGSWACINGSGIVTAGSGGHLALYIGCNGTSGTLSKLGVGVFASGVATYFHGIRIA